MFALRGIWVYQALLKIGYCKRITVCEEEENSNLIMQNGYSVWLESAICDINLSISLTATSNWQWPTICSTTAEELVSKSS